MKRREFIWVSSLSCIAIALPISSCSSSHSDLIKNLILPTSLSIIMNKELINELGKYYIEFIGNDLNDIESIRLQLAKNSNLPKSGDLELEVLKIANNIEKKIIEDFRMERIIQLKGWILSYTEAQQCALFYLTEN